MNIALSPGERYGQLTVLENLRSGKYRVGCECGFSKDAYRPGALMRAVGVRKCRRCRKQEQSK